MPVDKSVIEALREFQEEGKPDFLKELFELFVTMTPAMIERMEKGLETRDFQTIFRTAHNLKSQAGNLGAMRLSILSGEIEIQARAASPSVDKLAPLLTSVGKEYLEVEKELRHLLFV